MELKIEHRLTELENRTESNQHRLDEMEKRQDDIEELVLIGHSFGGRVAIKFAFFGSCDSPKPAKSTKSLHHFIS